MSIAIIGGGAAGMMAAAVIKEKNPNEEVYLIEKNHYLGAKILISGGGRCNVTTGITDINEVLKKYPRGSRFLRYAMHEFGPSKVMEFFENKGTKLKTEEDLRVFPFSDNGKDVVGTFEEIFKNTNTKVLLSKQVEDISKKNDKFKITFSNGESLEIDKIIITTGGQAYKITGSTGDGYDFAKSLGHTITDLAPSLNSFILKEDFVKNIAGVSFDKVNLKLKGKLKDYNFEGAILFTHKGITGPATFALSSLSAYEKYDRANPLDLYIDFFPEQNYEEFQNYLKDQITKNPKKLFRNILDQFLPKSFAEMLCHPEVSRDFLSQARDPSLHYRSAQDDKEWKDKIGIELSKKDLNKTTEFLKNMKVTIIGRGVGDEFVTAGGVNLKEIDDKTMQSKICPNLYFAGEILDIDGFTGGFNLQAAWATGYLAGKNI